MRQQRAVTGENENSDTTLQGRGLAFFVPPKKNVRWRTEFNFTAIKLNVLIAGIISFRANYFLGSNQRL